MPFACSTETRPRSRAVSCCAIARAIGLAPLAALRGLAPLATFRGLVLLTAFRGLVLLTAFRGLALLAALRGPMLLAALRGLALLAALCAIACSPACAQTPLRSARRAPAGSANGSVRAPAASAASVSAGYLSLAETGVARAQRLWRDRRLGWYDSRLYDRDRYPLATIWDAVPLFEALDAIDLAAPSPAHRAAVAAFANGAERYYDRGLGPVAGYAPYPGDRGRATAWFDDNGWWGLGFLDAYRASGSARYLRDAQRAFRFIARAGWNAGGGGLWWNTAHAYIAGEPLAAGSLLGAQLFKLTGDVSYREAVLRFLNWADASFVSERGLYKRTSFDPTPTPYIEGTTVEAHQVLCEAGVGQACAWARALADACWERFQDRLDMGPQFDVIYLHEMLLYSAQTGDGRWRALAGRMAADAQAHARGSNGLFLRGWDGTPITEHQAAPNMLQSDAATLELFAWLAAVP